MKSRVWIAGLVLLALTVGMLHAQRRQGRFNRSEFRGLGSFDNTPPDTEFIFARWHYSAGRFRGDGWAHDYPTAEEHILQIMKETSRIDVERASYRIVELSSPEIFQYPFSYVSEPGEMQLTDLEVVNL